MRSSGKARQGRPMRGIRARTVALRALGLVQVWGAWGLVWGLVWGLAGLERSALAQCEPIRLVSPDGDAARRFGWPVAVSADDRGERLAIAQDGSVWALDLVDGRPLARQELRSPFPVVAERFGIGMDMRGDRLAIGALRVFWPDRPLANGGAAVYDRVDGAWMHTGTLRPPATAAFEGAVGAWPVIDGDTIVAGGASGSPIVVYREAPGTADGWAPVQTIERPAGVGPGAEFGYPLVARDGWLFVGAHRDFFPGIGVAGSIVVYRRGVDGAYALTQTINGPGLGAYSIRSFGRSMGSNGTTLAVGARDASPRLAFQGAIYLFELDGARWTLRQTLTHSGAEEGDGLGGVALAMDGDRLVAQAIKDGADRSDHTVFAFERTAAGLWRQSARLLPIPPTPPAPFGYAADYGSAIALHGDRVLIGASGERAAPRAPQTGAAYLFDLSCYACPDLDGDDRLTIFDTLEFLRAFEAGEPIADFDNDGALTVLDYAAFERAFAAGCP